MMKEEKIFKAESKQLLNLMINSIYSNQEIFLREIISNASDAIDKYRYLLATDEGKDLKDRDYQIRIEIDKESRSIKVIDNGIGMNRQDLEKNLGTIAKSGSKEFLEKLSKNKDKKDDLSIIGQFGVGFYSAFMVGKKVEVKTRREKDKCYLFSSDGIEKYSIEDIDDDSFVGTEVSIYLRDDEEEVKYSSYLEEYRIKSLVKKYSDYIRYPIHMNITSTENDKDENGKEIEGKTHEVITDTILNSMIPLWKKPKSEVTDEKLNEFYKTHFDDYEDPLISLYVKTEGVISYSAILYIPAHAPYNLYSDSYEKGLALYSKGIFVQEKCKELVSDYLKFTKGLVDSDDFPLNISREILQNSPLLKKISSNIENKLIEKLKDLQKNDYDKYLKFVDIYIDNIKYGIYSSYGAKKDLLADLLVYKTNKDEKGITLKKYVEDKKEDQKYIYYATGKTPEEILLKPEMEKYKRDDIQVLLLTSNIDEFCLMMMQNYDKLEFKNISSENKDEITEEEKKRLQTLTDENKRFLDEIKNSLKDKIDEVSFSNKLVDSPLCITSKEGLSLNMEKVLENQPKMDEDSHSPKAIKVLEINPDHKLFKAIKDLDDESLKKYAPILYEEALLLEGYEVEDKKSFVENLNNLLINKK